MEKRDSQTTVEELKDVVREFCEDRDWDQFHDPKELAIGMSTEANELLQIFRFKNKEQMEQMMQDPDKRKHIEEELVDCIYFGLRFAQLNDIDLSTALRAKVAENAKKYPVDLVKGRNEKYNEYE